MNMQGDFCPPCTSQIVGENSGIARLMRQGTLTTQLPMLPDVGEGVPQIMKGFNEQGQEDAEDHPMGDPSDILNLEDQGELP